MTPVLTIVLPGEAAVLQLARRVLLQYQTARTDWLQALLRRPPKSGAMRSVSNGRGIVCPGVCVSFGGAFSYLNRP